MNLFTKSLFTFIPTHCFYGVDEVTVHFIYKQLCYKFDCNVFRKNKNTERTDGQTGEGANGQTDPMI